MRRLNRKRFLGRQSGFAMVELAIALPVLLFMFLVAAEFGRALFQYNQLTQSVRDGARYAASKALLGSTGVVNIQGPLLTETDNLVVYADIDGSGTPLLPGLAVGDTDLTNVGGGDIEVTASYNYQPMLGAVLPDFGLGAGGTPLNFTLRATVRMRAL